jgi:hypothetical protein
MIQHGDSVPPAAQLLQPRMEFRNTYGRQVNKEAQSVLHVKNLFNATLKTLRNGFSSVFGGSCF